MSDYNDNYYTRTCDVVPRHQSLSGSVDVEVCVIGGGLAGLAIALDLAERGHKVGLLERHRVGWGASGRSGGDISPGFTLSTTELVRRLGYEHARELYHLSLMGHTTVSDWIKKYSIDCGPLQRGALRCAKADAQKSLQQYCDFMGNVFGMKMEYWPKAEVRQALNTSYYSDAVFNPHTYTVHALQLVHGLARALIEKGGRIFESTQALSLIMHNKRKKIISNSGNINADHVVLACGGYADYLHSATWWANVPISTFLMVTEPLGDKLDGSISVPFAISDIEDPPNYYRTLPDGRLMWGGHDLIWAPPTVNVARMLKRDMVGVFPELRNTQIDVAWGGRMSYFRHSMPVIGRIGDGLWCATGFGGLGLAISAMAGRLIGGAISEGDDRWRLFSKFGLPFAGGPFGKITAPLNYWQ